MTEAMHRGRCAGAMPAMAPGKGDGDGAGDGPGHGPECYRGLAARQRWLELET